MCCEHKNQVPIEIDFPKSIMTKCKDCGATFEYNGLTITSREENLGKSASVIKTSVITYNGGHDNAL